jgi:hypothetical protein
MEALFGGMPTGPAIQVWERRDKRTHSYGTPKGAADFASKIKGDDVYVAAGLAPKVLPPSKRRTSATEVVGIPGIWADLDVNGGPDNKQNAAPDPEAAIELAHAILQPTLLINSGYGIQAWWLLEEPWIFNNDDEREQAQRLVQAFQAALRGRAAIEGYSIDSTYDLARLMRIPGTENCKGLDRGLGAAPVALLDLEGPTHELEALGQVAQSYMGQVIEAAKVASGQTVKAQVRPDAAPPPEKLDMLLEVDDDFAAVWRHRKNAKREAWTMSEWEMSITARLVIAGWSDQEIADTIVYHRLKWEPNDPRGKNRPARIRTTIGKARAAIQREEIAKEELLERNEATDQLAHVGRQAVERGVSVNRDQVVSLFTRIIGGPQIKELVQDSRDPDQARFRIVLADGTEVPIGKIRSLTKQDDFRDRFAVVTGHYPRTVKRQSWEEVIQALLAAAVVRDVEDDRRTRVRGWLEHYLNRDLSSDRNAAAEAIDPFEFDGKIHVPLSRFRMYLRKIQGERIEEMDLKLYLEAAGFERRTIGYTRQNGKKSTRSYFVIDKVVLDP